MSDGLLTLLIGQALAWIYTSGRNHARLCQIEKTLASLTSELSKERSTGMANNIRLSNLEHDFAAHTAHHHPED